MNDNKYDYEKNILAPDGWSARSVYTHQGKKYL